MQYYIPLLGYFFTNEYKLTRDPEDFVRRVGSYRNEKPLTFLLEMVSHLFFYAKDRAFGGVTYDGGYRVDERRSSMRRVYSLQYVTDEHSWLQKIKLSLPFKTSVRYGCSDQDIENDLQRARSQAAYRGEFVSGDHFSQ